jgi:TorA maturation chaperone TorD
MTVAFDPRALSMQRADSYAFLAAIAAAPLSAAVLDDLRDAARRQSGSGFATELLACLASNADPDLRLNLARDHARLFGGLFEGYGPKAPYASLWRSGAMMGPATAAVARAYVESGFAPDCAGGPCDHVSDLLTCMAWLAMAEAQGTHSDTRARQVRFLDDHLLPWVPGWAAEVQAQARQPFYATWAAVLTRFLHEDAGYLRGLT